MKRRIADEPIVLNQLPSHVAVIELIDMARMMCTMNNLGIFYSKLVQEFIFNIPTDFNEPGTLDF